MFNHFKLRCRCVGVLLYIRTEIFNTFFLSTSMPGWLRLRSIYFYSTIEKRKKNPMIDCVFIPFLLKSFESTQWEEKIMCLLQRLN